MSKFFSAKYAKLVPYEPGEQPKDAQYVKLNTNESPFPPPQSVVEAAKAEVTKLQLEKEESSKKEDWCQDSRLSGHRAWCARVF